MFHSGTKNLIRPTCLLFGFCTFLTHLNQGMETCPIWAYHPLGLLLLGQTERFRGQNQAAEGIKTARPERLKVKRNEQSGHVRTGDRKQRDKKIKGKNPRHSSLSLLQFFLESQQNLALSLTPLSIDQKYLSLFASERLSRTHWWTDLIFSFFFNFLSFFFFLDQYHQWKHQPRWEWDARDNIFFGFKAT